MEAVLLQYSSPDQPISPYKSQYIRTTATPQKKGAKMNRSLISRPSENFGSLNTHHGLIQTPQAPPHVFQSYPPFTVRQQQPPLLPLPTISKPQNFNSSHAICRGLSCPTPLSTNKTLKLNNNNSRNRDSSLTPRKSKPKTTTTTTTSPRKKEEDLKPVNTAAKVVSSSSPPQIISSGKPLGPDPKHLPMNVSKICIHTNNNNTTNTTFSSFKAVVKDEIVVEYSGSVAFTISPPPPSSLPLPTFSLRPKLCCNTKAAGVDVGATDDLRRLLRLP